MPRMPLASSPALATWCSLFLLAACNGPGVVTDGGTDAGSAADAGASDAGPSDAGAPDAGPPASCVPGDPEVVRFTTDDGLMLEGDLYLSGRMNGATAVLLHMIPPFNDRTNYPRELIDELVRRCITVLNVDRRGAGGSEGVAADAYMGPNGALDAKGAVEYLLAHSSAPDPLRTSVVGASNGTTTALDFMVFTVAARTLEDPAAIVLLSGGDYTENQNTIADTSLDTIPTQFVYPESERAWNAAIEVDAPSLWQFREYTPGAHGTGVFGTNPEAVGDVADFLEVALSP